MLETSEHVSLAMMCPDRVAYWNQQKHFQIVSYFPVWVRKPVFVALGSGRTGPASSSMNSAGTVLWFYLISTRMYFSISCCSIRRRQECFAPFQSAIKAAHLCICGTCITMALLGRNVCHVVCTPEFR